MRLKKWVILLFYVYLFGAFAYLSYLEFMDDRGIMWILLAVAAIGLGYQIIDFLIRKKGDRWNSSYVVADDRIFRKILISLALSYVFILAFLLIGTIGLYNGFIAGHPINVMVAAIILSLLIFMLSQIVQRFIG
ncbi:hypothetical protein [Lentibacillus sp. CBA3610]|uniref:hypothetical protein n=1 Tax=Lentibacillus sp. CBA3610 TaxID=2518176 RepID=UPI001595DC2C|nr:hypothetical protein [Lentibacillus sp. CBA3610]QKY70668.1 hypothetical protein Len3610_14670 [Lentibacillus sp. CBA3610]